MDEAFQIAVFLITLLLSSALRFFSRFELLYHKKPDYSFLQPFGCSCLPYVGRYSYHKFDFHSSKCIFIRYSQMHAWLQVFTSFKKGLYFHTCPLNLLQFPYKSLFMFSHSSTFSFLLTYYSYSIFLSCFYNLIGTTSCIFSLSTYFIKLQLLLRLHLFLLGPFLILSPNLNFFLFLLIL